MQNFDPSDTVGTAFGGYTESNESGAATTTMCTADSGHRLRCSTCGNLVPMHSHSRHEWAPGLLPRALILNLGYVIGDAVYESKNGTRVAAFLFLTLLANEFAAACLGRTMEDASSKMSSVERAVLDRVERVLVLVRYFAVTAVASALNTMLKRTFTEGLDVVTVVLIFLMIFVVADLIDGATTTSAPGPGRR